MNKYLLEAFKLEEKFQEFDILKQIIKQDYMPWVQDCLRRFNKDHKKLYEGDVFIPPIQLKNIEITNYKHSNDYPKTDMPYIKINCSVELNKNTKAFDKDLAAYQLGDKYEEKDYINLLIGDLQYFLGNKIYGDSTSGLRKQSKFIKQATILNDKYRYEVCELDNPDISILNDHRITSNTDVYNFEIIMRPVKRRVKKA